MTTPKTCEWCGDSFTPRPQDRNRAKYCQGKGCSRAAANAKQRYGGNKPAPEFTGEHELRLALRKAQTELDKAKQVKGDLIEAVYQAAHDGISAMTIPSVPKPKADPRTRDSETAVVLLSDWQLGKTTPDYNSQVCEERIKALAKKVEDLTAIQRQHHPVKELRIYALGDIVEGEAIFPGQAHRIDSSMFRQTFEGARILAEFVRRMSATFERVHVVGVIGNHGSLGGRNRKEYHPETNMDSFLLEVTKMTTESPRVTWAPTWTQGERHWYALDTVGSKTFMLFHGDQIRGGFAGFPWYGQGKKVAGWRTAFDVFGGEHFDYAVHGHFHTPMNTYLNGVRIWCNGATESYNTYALEELASAGEPCQWLLYVHPSKGVSAEYLVRLG